MPLAFSRDPNGHSIGALSGIDHSIEGKPPQKGKGVPWCTEAGSGIHPTSGFTGDLDPVHQVDHISDQENHSGLI